MGLREFSLLHSETYPGLNLDDHIIERFSNKFQFFQLN